MLLAMSAAVTLLAASKRNNRTKLPPCLMRRPAFYQVLLSDPENVKGLFRTGQLHLRLKNIEAAKVRLVRRSKTSISYQSNF